MSIGTTIKKLRRDRDFTQEQLADLLGITANAISQWECDRTAPDLSQIPLLTRIFHVTADELLEIDRQNAEKEMEDLHDQIYELSRIGRHREAFSFAREAHQKYPDNYALMHAYASHFCYIVGDASYPAEEKDVLWDECIHLLEKVSAECTEEYLRQPALSQLCWMYRDRGQLKKAEETVEKFPSLVNSQQFLRTTLYGGNRGMEAHRDLLFSLIEHLSNRMIRTGSTDDDQPVYSPAERCTLCQKRLALLEVLYENGDYGFFFDDVRDAHITIAEFCAEQKDAGQTLDHLEAARDAVVRYRADFYQKNYVHTSLLFRNYAVSGEGIWYAESDNDASVLFTLLTDEKFDFVRADPRFIAVVQELDSLRGSWGE